MGQPALRVLSRRRRRQRYGYAERAIRALFPRLAQIRRLVLAVAKRKTQRRALIPFRPEVVRGLKSEERDLRDAVLRRLQQLAVATGELYVEFGPFNPAATEYPLTLSGWRAFEKSILEELAPLGFKRSG